jgi:mannose-1-phosphate guanylyltransferase / phosphomannomutase
MSSTGMQAVIMAGGEGSRLRPLTSNMPKPMLPVANRPLMEHIITLLREHGITDIVATVQFLSSLIRNYFGDGSDLDVSLAYATEDVPMGTAGSVLGARDLLSGSFLVVSGDALTDLDVREVVAFHREKGAAATLVLKRVPDPLEFGIVMTKEDGRIERFLEKPTWGQVFSDAINTGIYVLEPEVLDLMPVDEPYDFSSQLFPMMLDKGLPLYGHSTSAYWTDVGNTDAFMQANQDVLAGKVNTEPGGFELAPSVWVGEDVEIDPSARLEGPVLIGDNARIGAGAEVRPGAILGDNVIVENEATIVRGVMMDGAHLGANARISSAIVGRGASVGRGAILEEGAVLGDEVTVGAGALIKSRVRVYPSRTVESGAIVTESVVRERRVSRSLFGSRGVSGRVNVGLTPVTAVRLGMAYGSTLKRGSVVVTGRDASRAARTMKRAVIAGLNSTGVTCHDLELMPLPLTRFTVIGEQAAGGINVRTSPGDPETVEVRLFDGDGADLAEGPQRKIERVFFREDYRRAAPARLGELEFPPRALEQYASGLLAAVDVEAIRDYGPKVVADLAFGPAALVTPSVLGRLGCDVLTVNGFVNENRPALTKDELETHLTELSMHVRNSGSDLGVLLEPGGEIAHLVDGTGRSLSPDAAFLVLLQHEVRRGATRVAFPVSASSAAWRIAEAGGAKVQVTPTARPALMAHASRPGIGFAGDGGGAVIFPSFMPAPDGLMTFAKALELVATAGRPLFEVVDELPPRFVVGRDVPTPWRSKGAVMRWLASWARTEKPHARVVLVDGVKMIEGDRWALVIPHPDEPSCRIWVEGRSFEDAEAMSSFYAGVVEKAVGEDE